MSLVIYIGNVCAKRCVGSSSVSQTYSQWMGVHGASLCVLLVLELLWSCTKFCVDVVRMVCFPCVSLCFICVSFSSHWARVCLRCVYIVICGLMLQTDSTIKNSGIDKSMPIRVVWLAFHIRENVKTCSHLIRHDIWWLRHTPSLLD